MAPRLTNGGAGPHQSGRGGFFMSQAGASVKPVSPEPLASGKAQNEPHSCLCSFGRDIVAV